MNKKSPYILVVDDEPDIRQLVCEILADEGYQVSMAKDAQTARELKKKQEPSLILLDIWMPDTDGITLLKEWAQEESLPLVVMMSGHGSVETAVEATRLGAYDFLEKPLSLAKLLLTVERALETRYFPQEKVSIKQPLLLDIEPVGKSATIQRLKEQLKRLAHHETGVLFVGEAGVGKQLYARYLHHHSHRREGAFVDVAIHHLSAESSAIELFGKEENGRIYPGLLEQAHKGTLFLDQISNMDMPLQTQLLTALESGYFFRMEGKQVIEIDVRVIASTRITLDEAISAGHFRQDLYYLLNVVTLDIHPLRQHNEDVPSLLNFYVDYMVRIENLPFRKFSMAAQNFLRNYYWQGNIKELKNLVQRLMILGIGDDIELEEVKNALGSTDEQPALLDSIPTFFNLSLKEAREHFEKSYLEYHFEKNSRSVAKLAVAIGMERTHLYRKLHALNIKL